MPTETLPAPQPQAPARFDAEQCALEWLRSTAVTTEGNLPWAWTPTIGRELRTGNTATQIVAAVDPGQWWTRAGDGWQPTNPQQIRAALDTWGHANRGFTEHPGRADAAWRDAYEWLRAHASHTTGGTRTQTLGRPPTTWARRNTDGTLPDDARSCAELFLAERYYPPAPQGGRRLGWWHGSYHAWTPDGWQKVNNADTVTEQIRGWLNGTVDVPAVDLEVRGICDYHPVDGQLPTPLDLADHDQHQAAQHTAKTIVPQPIGAPV